MEQTVNKTAESPSEGSSPAQGEQKQVATKGAEQSKPLTFGDLDDMFSPSEAKEPLPFKTKDEDGDDEDDETELQENEQDDSESESDGSDESEESEEETEEEGEGDEEESEEEDGVDRSKLSPEELAKKFKIKVDGKERTYTLDQILKNASSGFHTKERYEKFEQEKQQFVSQKQSTEKVLSEQQAKLAYADTIATPFVEALKKKDVIAAISHLAPHAGTDSLEMERSLLRNALPQIAQRLGLTAEEVKQRLQANAEKNRTLDLEQEAKFFKQKAEREAQLREKNSQPDPTVQAQQSIKEFAVQMGVTMDQLSKAADMAAELKGDPNAVTFDDIQVVIERRRVVDRALDAIETRRPALVQDNAFVDRVIKAVIDNPAWSARQLGGFIEEEARKAADGKKGSLERTISKKAQKTNLKSRYENSSQERKPMKFADLQKEGGLM
jgi:hypothetical protein